MQHDRIVDLCRFKTVVITSRREAVSQILMQFRNHEPGVCYLNIVYNLGRRIRSDFLEISVTEYILWNMHTVCDLLCVMMVKWQPISGLCFRVTSPSLGISWWEIRQFAQSQWSSVDWCGFVHLVYLPRTVITDLKNEAMKNCAYLMGQHVRQIYTNLAVSIKINRVSISVLSWCLKAY